MASNYSENLSEEIKKGRNEKILNGGYPHRAPYGYRNNKELKTIEVDEKAALFVREAFDLYSSGLYSLERLADKLHEGGFIYRPQQPKISKPGLSKILKNPFYIGQMEIQGVTYEGSHTPIVPIETWQKAQSAGKRSHKPFAYATLAFKYQNMLRCASCRASMVGENKKGGRYTYYRCSRQKYGCHQGYINEAKVDKLFERFVQSLVVSEEYKQAIIASLEVVENCMNDTTEAELAKYQGEVKQYRSYYRKALQEKIEGNLDEETWRMVSEDYQDIIRNLEAQIQRIQQAISRAGESSYEVAKRWVELPETLARRWPRLSSEKKIILLNDIGSNFFIEGEELRYELKEPFSMLERKALCTAWWSIGDSNS